MKISCSLLSCDDKMEVLKKINNTLVDYVHIDVMDGTFVDNHAYSFLELSLINDNSLKKLDVHLMVDDPLSYIEKLDSNNICFITFHVEIAKDIKVLINEVKKRGFKCGLSISPDTDLEKLEPYINDIDMILVMSVFPGYGGQAFLESTYDRVLEIKEKINRIKPDVLIAVDGGINFEVAKKLKDYVDILVVGSYLTKGNLEENVSKLLNI